MNKTANFQLNKPEENEYIDINVLNENMDIVDQELKNTRDTMSSEIRKLTRTRHVMLLAAEWSSTYPYEQTVLVEDVVSNDDLRVIGVVHQDGNTQDQDKAIDKAAGQLMYHGNGVRDGALVFRAKKKPEVDFTVIMTG